MNIAFSVDAGAALDRPSWDRLVAQCPQVTCVHAQVKEGNMRSIALFKAAGYDGDYARFTRKLKRYV